MPKIPPKSTIRISFIYLTFTFPKSSGCFCFYAIFIHIHIIIIWCIKFCINIFLLIKFFPWIFVSLIIDAKINASGIRTSKCTFSFYFNWCFFWTKIHIYNTPLSYATELFNLFKPSFLLKTFKIHLKVTPFVLNIAILFKE